MARRPRSDDYVDVVRANRTATLGYVLAESGDCLGIQRDEVRRVRGRKLKALKSSDLRDLRPAGSWALAAILCRGDTTGDLAAWASLLDVGELDRIWFYEHPDADPARVYEGWVGAGLPNPLRDVVRDFASFHVLFGNDLNDQIYADAKRAP